MEKEAYTLCVGVRRHAILLFIIFAPNIVVFFSKVIGLINSILYGVATYLSYKAYKTGWTGIL